MATKQDLKELEAAVQLQFSEFETKLIQMEYRLVVKMSTIVGAMVTMAIAVTTAVAKLL